MKKLLILLLSSAVLAACGAAAGSSGSAGARDTPNAGTVLASQGANADSESDVNRVNPPITKGTHPAPVTPAQPQTAAPNTVQSQPPADRCNGGGGTGAAGSRAATPLLGKRPPLPACMPE